MMTADAVLERSCYTWAPPPDYTVSEWADAERFLPTSSGARGSRWRTEAVPYLRGPMDAVNEPGVSTIAIRKASQIGASEALHNIVGYFMQHQPCPMLFVHPTAGVAEEWSKDRLADMIRTTPALRAIVSDRKDSDEGASTLNLKVFPNGYLALGGANTPNTFARRAVRVAFGDDIDRWPANVGDEGAPEDLLRNRTETFFDALVMLVSTPTLKGGRIDTLYERSDRRRFFVPCPNCGAWRQLTWNDATQFRVIWQERDAESARIACPDEEHGGCGARMQESQRREMLTLGTWRPTAVAQEQGLVGFHMPAMLSTIGKRTLQGLVDRWLAAQGKGKDALKVFVNTQLAEGWEERGARMDSHVLSTRREFYGEGVEVPAKAAALTAGVDVQDNRLEVHVMAWGLAGERWTVDYRTVPGDPKKPDVWASLLEQLQRRYVHASGHQLPILSTCIDSGWATEEVYSFVAANAVRRYFATKGLAGRQGTPIVHKPSEQRYGKNPRPCQLFPINVDDAKSDVYNALSVEAEGPSYWHFPNHLDTVADEFFAQLCAEHKETRYSTGGIATSFVWVQDRERNEVLDTSVLAYAAYRLLNPNIAQMLATIASRPVAAAPSDVTRPPAAPSQPSGGERRITRSSYLNRG